jgi:hypothetical protein
VVTFNEVNFNPPGSQDGEWIELHNQMAVNVDISGWRLSDGITYTFANGTVIPAGGFLVIARNPAHGTLAGLGGVLGPYNGNLSNSGEAVELLGRSGRRMDRIEYGDIGEWPIAPDGAGATLVKRHPGLSSADPANWTASRISGGTPGSPNFPPARSVHSPCFCERESAWRFDDSDTPQPSSWTAASFNDAAWATGSPLFGTASAAPALAVTQHLVARYRAGAVTGVANGAAFSPWFDTATGDGIARNATAGGDPRYQSAVTLKRRAGGALRWQ